MIGNQLKDAGWRQGSIVKPEDTKGLLESANIPYDEGIVLLVASHSCDITNNDMESAPCIELSLARVIPEKNGNFEHNKNPRTLHTSLTYNTDEEKFTEKYIELKAAEKISLRKEALAGRLPSDDKTLREPLLKSYVAWLAARYSRPALPTAFNDKLKAADPKGKLRKEVKKGNSQLTGIYVQIIPDAEIGEDERYRVNLLGLMPANVKSDQNEAESVIKDFAEIMREAGMDVPAIAVQVQTEDAISVHYIKRFKRFYYDDLSFKEDTHFPPEV